MNAMIEDCQPTWLVSQAPSIMPPLGFLCPILPHINHISCFVFFVNFVLGNKEKAKDSKSQLFCQIVT